MKKDINDNEVFELIEGGDKIDLFNNPELHRKLASESTRNINDPSKTVTLPDGSTTTYIHGNPDVGLKNPTLTREEYQQALDVAGLANPLADVANASIYLYNKEYGSAALSGASILPIADILKWAWRGGKKLLGKGPKVAEKAVEWEDLPLREAMNWPGKEAYMKEMAKRDKEVEKLYRETLKPKTELGKLGQHLGKMDWDHEALDEIMDIIERVGFEGTDDYVFFAKKLQGATSEKELTEAWDYINMIRPGYIPLTEKIEGAIVNNPGLEAIYQKIKGMHVDDIQELRLEIAKILDTNPYGKHITKRDFDEFELDLQRDRGILDKNPKDFNF